MFRSARKWLVLFSLTALAALAYAATYQPTPTKLNRDFTELEKRAIEISKRGTKPDLIGNDASADMAEENRRRDNDLFR